MGHEPEQEERVWQVRVGDQQGEGQEGRQQEDDEKGDDAAEAKATAACKKQQAADAAKFAKDYKNFGQCVKAAKGDEDDD